MFWNTWNCFSNDFIDRDQVTVARISFCNWIYFLSPTIRISLPTPRQRAGEQHRRVAWPGVITFMIRIWLLHSRHFWESVEQRGWCFKLLWFWATWTISWVHYAEALYWMRHLSWGMWRAGEYWGGEMLQVGGWTDLMLTFHIDWLLMRAFLQPINISTEFLVMETQIMKTGLTQLCISQMTWKFGIT